METWQNSILNLDVRGWLVRKKYRIIFIRRKDAAIMIQKGKHMIQKGTYMIQKGIYMIQKGKYMYDSEKKYIIIL